MERTEDEVEINARNHKKMISSRHSPDVLRYGILIFTTHHAEEIL